SCRCLLTWCTAPFTPMGQTRRLRPRSRDRGDCVSDEDLESGGRPAAGDADDDVFRRPGGLSSSFEPNPDPPEYSPPPPTVAPDEADVFGRPAGAGAYLPRPGDRVPPRQVPPPAVP